MTEFNYGDVIEYIDDTFDENMEAAKRWAREHNTTLEELIDRRVVRDDIMYRYFQIAIRILTDKRQAAMKSSKVTQMHDSGFDIRVHTKNKIEHNKFAVFDGKELTTGSFNWTNAASDKNSENCMFFKHEPEQVQKFRNRFEELWKINTQAKSEEWFAKRKAKH